MAEVLRNNNHDEDDATNSSEHNHRHQVGAVEMRQEEEESNDNEDQAAASAVVLGPYDPGRMELTDEEHTWALEIKEAIENEPEMDSLSDFWYAHLALIDRDDVESAVERAQKMQYFWQEYDVRPDCQTGCKAIRDLMNFLPGFYLSLSFNHRDGNYVIVTDTTKILTKELTSRPGGVDAWLKATYFIMQVMNPDLEAVRRGIIILAECEGFSLSKNFGIETSRRLWMELTSVYPMRFHQFKCFHSSMFYNVLVSMSRGFMPSDIYKRIETGCLCELGRLDRLYLNPDLASAEEKFMASVKDALERRYEQEASFKL